MLAANNIPIKVTAIASPPLKPENKLDKLIRRFSAILDFSNVMPMNMNRGIANSVVLVMIPYNLFGSPIKKASSKTPKIIPIKAKIRDVPANAKATGIPINKIAMMIMNRRRERYSTTMISSVLYSYRE